MSEKLYKHLKCEPGQYADVYIAGPFFNAEQLERVEAIKQILSMKGLTYFSPKDNIMLSPDASIEERRKAFEDNIKNICGCSWVLCITDGKDVGTMFEAGVAYAVSTPIVYFAETLGDRPFNVMLSESGIKVLRSRQELMDWDPNSYVKEEWMGDVQ